jgi:peptidoglycan L-alanyl-D-glutamate endopeptidase CwlK
LWHNHYAVDWHIVERAAKGWHVSIILSSRSLSRLEGVHPDLVRVVKKAAAMSDLDFTVLEGLRTVDRQKQLVKQGASKTLNSRHITGHAVDLAPLIDGKVSWDWPLYHRLAKIIKAAAADENVPITWGGDWRTFKDGPHWELPWKIYPKGK